MFFFVLLVVFHFVNYAKIRFLVLKVRRLSTMMLPHSWCFRHMCNYRRKDFLALGLTHS